jgi:hypothetical protein
LRQGRSLGFRRWQAFSSGLDAGTAATGTDSNGGDRLLGGALAPVTKDLSLSSAREPRPDLGKPPNRRPRLKPTPELVPWLFRLAQRRRGAEGEERKRSLCSEYEGRCLSESRRKFRPPARGWTAGRQANPGLHAATPLALTQGDRLPGHPGHPGHEAERRWERRWGQATWRSDRVCDERPVPLWEAGSGRLKTVGPSRRIGRPGPKTCPPVVGCRLRATGTAHGGAIGSRLR